MSPSESQNAGDAVTPDRIRLFLEKVSQRIPTKDFLRDFHALFPFIQTSGLTEDYRLGKAPLKRIRDEVAILANYLELAGEDYEYVRFFLNSDIPDARLWRNHETIDVEITQVQAKARRFLMEELNKTGGGRGFLPIDDSQPNNTFRGAMAAERECYSTEEYRLTLEASILRCLHRKFKSDRSGYLLIGAPVGEEYVPSSALSAVRIDVPPSGFERTYLIDRDRLLRIA